MTITASEARRELFRLIEQVNLDRSEIEIMSKLVETSCLLRSLKNACRMLSCVDFRRLRRLSVLT